MAESPATDTPETFPQAFGRYTLTRRLGEGGMGDVYLASLKGGIEGVEKNCVIKKLKRTFSGDEEFVGRFLDEARLSVQLSHANIVPVFDAGTQDGDYYLAMEHVDGADLKDLLDQQIKNGTHIPQPLAVWIAREILSALSYAHKKKDAQGRPLGLVHRDISPQNILLSFSGEVKLIDFGLAKSSQKALKTNPNVVLGKYAYMSPEQARGQPIDGRSDLFAVALLLWEMLTNRKLFDGVTVGELMEQIAEHRVFAASKVNPDVDPDLDALLNRALLKDVGKRFQTAEEFREALLHIQNRIGATVGSDDLSREIKRARGIPLTTIGPPPTRPAPRASVPKAHPVPRDEPTLGMDESTAPAAEAAPPPPAPRGAPMAPPRGASGKASAAAGGEEFGTDLIRSRPNQPAAGAMPTWKLVAMGLGTAIGVAALGAGGWYAMRGSPAPVVETPPAEEKPAPAAADTPPADDKGKAPAQADKPAGDTAEEKPAEDGKKKAASGKTSKKKARPTKKKR